MKNLPKILKQIVLICLASLLSLSVTNSALSQDMSNIQQQLLSEIQTEKQRLNSSEARIRQERHTLIDQLRTLELQVSEQRDKTAAALRASDERTLSLNTLHTRLDQWREQSLYQHYLINSFYSLVHQELAHHEDSSVFTTLTLNEKLAWLNNYLTELQTELRPAWKASDIILSDGTMTEASVLSIGPVQWFMTSDLQTGGLLHNHFNSNQESPYPSTGYIYNQQELEGLLSLYHSSSGEVTFDPTLNRALDLSNQQGSLLDHIREGGLWAIPILLFAVLALAVSLAKAFQFSRLPKLHTESLATFVSAPNNSLKLSSIELELINIARNTKPGQNRDDQLFSYLMKNKHQLEKWLGTIAVIASVSPLLGLLGTVSGMIETFQLMTLFGAGDPEAVSSGISKALITTELGLIVAIPALLAHAVLSRMIKNYLSTLENNALELSQVDEVQAV